MTPASSDRPVFKLIWGDREIALEEGENLLGRDPLSVACIDVASVSRHHARITVTGDQATIEDLDSKNGTYVRDRKLRGATPLADGDALRLGSVPLIFRRFGSGGSTQTAWTGDGQSQ
jgi:pSer/pThr/pTyr-binding forkhead associated (FHA) protein